VLGTDAHVVGEGKSQNLFGGKKHFPKEVPSDSTPLSPDSGGKLPVLQEEVLLPKEAREIPSSGGG